MIEVVLDDGLLLRLIEPVITWYPAVVFVGFTVTARPAGVRRRPQADPYQQLLRCDLGGCCPFTHIVDNFVAFFVGNPFAF